MTVNRLIAIVGTRFGQPDVESRELGGLGVSFRLSPAKSETELIESARDAVVVMAGGAPRFSSAVIGALSQCRAIVRYGVGVDTVDLAAATTHGIMVANVPDYATEEVSTHSVSLILASVRKLLAAHEGVLRGEWHIAALRPLFSLADQTIGIVGFGRIGQAVARKLRPFGCRLLVVDPYAPEEALARYGVQAVDLEALLAEADVVTLNAPLTDATHHLLNAQTLRLMKPTAFVVNTGRGGLIDETALLEAVQTGAIAGAAMDVSEQEPMPAQHPLLQTGKVIVTPHMAWYTEQATKRMRRLAAMETRRVLQNERPLHLVNPDVLMKLGATE